MAFLLGTAQILWLPSVNLVLLMVLIGLIVVLLFIKSKFQSAAPVLFFLCGFSYALLHCQLQTTDELKQPIKQTFQARVETIPKVSPQKTSFIGVDQQSKKTYLLNRYLQANELAPDLIVGALYEFEANLKPPHGLVNELGFDREKWLFRNHIDGIGSIKRMQLINDKPANLKQKINYWRQHISTIIDKNFSNQKVSGLIHALSIGDKSHFDQEDFQLFQNTGTAHLIAISGLHIGMVALLGWFVGGLLFRVWPQSFIPRPLLQIICGIILAVFYASLAGFAVATQRALIMILVYGYFKISRRASYGWDVWSTGLMLVLIIDPLNVLDAGFWLSFVAVAVLILAFSNSSKQRHTAVNFFKTQWMLLLGMLPLSLMVFSQVNLITPVVNLIMIPLMTFILIPLIFLMLLLIGVLQLIPAFLVVSLDEVSQFFLWMLQWFEYFSIWPIKVFIHSWWQFVLMIIGSLLLIVPKAIPQRYWGLLFILAAAINPKITPPVNQFKAHFLDVGQGLAVVIETHSHTMIYDVGAAYDSGFNMADAVILPFLAEHQINQLDVMMLSHQDNDHAGSAQYLVEQIPVKQIWGTENQHLACTAGQQWNWDGVVFTILSPLNLTPYLKNNSSCVLKIQAQHSSLLLTGDIESPVEYRLANLNASEIKSDVLLMPHHGSKTSSSASFINAVNPHTVINSSGQFNSFNHPATSILATYEKQGIDVIDTQNSGLISMSTFPALTFDETRKLSPKIWRKKKPE